MAQNSARLKYFTASQQLNKKLIADLFARADRFKDGLKSKRRLNILNGKTLILLFYEPSTRTRLSFEAAMVNLGGNVLSTENAKDFSSAVKGETLEDTVRVVQEYGDAIVVRHTEEGAADRMAAISRVPVINAGDGRGQHPTQALLDLYTIKEELGRMNDFKIAFVGDLTNGRTARSVSYLLGKFDGVEMTFVSPHNLRMRDDIKEYLNKHKVSFSEEHDLRKVLPKVDIVYMTRLQKERMAEADFALAKASQFIINMENFKLLKQGSRIMHPLPKVDEIQLPIEIEQKDQRVAYFRQAANGLPVRMALLEHLLQDPGDYQ